jgi:hypothetical protein
MSKEVLVRVEASAKKEDHALALQDGHLLDGPLVHFREAGRRLENMADLVPTELGDFQKILMPPIHTSALPPLWGL